MDPLMIALGLWAWSRRTPATSRPKDGSSEQGVLQWTVSHPIPPQGVQVNWSTYFDGSMDAIPGVPKLVSQPRVLTGIGVRTVLEATARFGGSTKGPLRPEVVQRWSGRVGRDWPGAKIVSARRVA